MKDLGDILPLFCKRTWPSHLVSHDCQIEVPERDYAVHHFLDERFLELKICKVLQSISACVKERVKQVTIQSSLSTM